MSNDQCPMTNAARTGAWPAGHWSLAIGHWSCLLAAAAAGMLAGCGPRAIDTHLSSPYPKTRVVAIAPFLNQSGSSDVDPLAVSDLFFSELQMVRGFQVLPVNRSLQAMAALNLSAMTGPGDVLQLAEFLGADLIFVGAVTAYNPYDPPELGLAVQLYARPGQGLDDDPSARLDVLALERSGRPFPVDPSASDPQRPRAQVNEVYNAGHRITQKQVREFADIREGGSSPLGWRLYTKSIQHFVRFCCHRAIRQVLDAEQGRVWMAKRNGP